LEKTTSSSLRKSERIYLDDLFHGLWGQEDDDAGDPDEADGRDPQELVIKIKDRFKTPLNNTVD
jgi:hypothetical protein